MADPVVGDSSNPNIPAVLGTQRGDGGTGVLGIGPANGVIGQSTGNGFSGVFGESETGPGVSGSSTSSVGVDARTVSGPAALRAIHEGGGIGVIGQSTGKGFSGFSGVFGESETGSGVSGSSTSSVGVDARTQSGPAALRAIHEGDGIGVIGACHGNGFSGVFGESKTGPGVSGSSTSSVGVDARTVSGPAALRAIHDGNGLAGHFKGDVEVIGNINCKGDVILANADCAEDFDIADLHSIEPGTVMVLGEEGTLHQSQRAYDKRVAGVISGAGDYKPGIVLDKQQSLSNRKPIALLGKVYCKVDANDTPVEVGDLLTTSGRPGHAMKATDPLKAFGAVIGKALGSLRGGQALIPILVALQ